MDMLTHQNVQSLLQVDYLPEPPMSQSDLSELSPVETVVKPVLNTETTVKFVPLTDLTHHIVDVLTDISKIILKKLVLNVNHVMSFVTLVKIQLDTALNVLIKVTEDLHHFVHVQMELMIMVNLFVLIVVHYVKLVPLP
jgi:hypothetical protein